MVTRLPSMGVVIATVGRRDLLGGLVARLNAQTLAPADIVLSVPSREHAPTDEELAAAGGARVVISPKGAAIQRNRGVAALSAQVEVVAFFDDDSLPRATFLEKAADHLAAHPECVAVSGHLALDGVQVGRPLTLAEMEAGVDEPWAEVALVGDKVQGYRRWYNLSGPCMVIRRGPFERLGGFDEGLPLYSWPEDREMAIRLRREGEVHLVWACICAHMGSVDGGRSSHVRFGYSQVANPWYLYRKGSISLRQMVHFSSRPVVRNFRDAPLSEERTWRRQRAAGNLLALSDLVRRRSDPHRITEL